MNTETDATEIATEADPVEPLITLASALLDTDRLRIAAALVTRPVNRMELAEFYNTTADSLRDGIDPIMLHKGESSDLEKIWKAAEAHARCVNRLYYTSHILFGVGIDLQEAQRLAGEASQAIG